MICLEWIRNYSCSGEFTITPPRWMDTSIFMLNVNSTYVQPSFHIPGNSCLRIMCILKISILTT